MALVLKVVKPETMSIEDFGNLHGKFHEAFKGSPAYMGVEICLSDIDKHTKTGEVYFPAIIGNGNDHDVTVVVNGEDLLKSMHPYNDEDLDYQKYR